MSSSPVAWSLSSQVCKACQDGNYESCICDKGSMTGKIYQVFGDLSNDSLDEDTNPGFRRKKAAFLSTGSYFTGEYISDDEFEDGFIKERPLPPSTTDWETIDSVLGKDIEEMEDDTSAHGSTLSSRLNNSSNMQMVFVDSDESDHCSNPDVEVFYDDHLRQRVKSDLHIDSERNIESCDSGYVAGDVLDYNIEHVTDKRRGSLEPVEASTRILASLQIHESYENRMKSEQEQEQDEMTTVHQQNVAELKEMKEALESRISQINVELVEELLMRDELHSYHESLLLDADDLSKTCNESKKSHSRRHSEDTRSSRKKVEERKVSCPPSETLLSPKSKSRFFWRR